MFRFVGIAVALGGWALGCSVPDDQAVTMERELVESGDSDVHVDDSDDTATGVADDACRIEVGDGLPVPQAASKRFLDSCASCHGKEGEGHEEFVRPIVGIGYEALRTYARAGLSYGMPAFDEAEYPDAILEHDWAWLNGVGAKLVDCDDRPMALDPSTTTEEAEEMVRDGLEAWISIDSEGMACASCHGPEPTDIALQGYTVGDMLRRALLHVDHDEAWAITYGVLARRHLSPPPDVDPEEDAIFQPGGELVAPAEVAGASLAQRRDAAVLSALLEAVPGLSSAVTGRVEAEAVLENLRSLDVASFPVGIEMRRWTVDAIRGSEFRQFDEWIPEVAHVSADPEEMAAVFMQYAAEPSTANLGELLHYNATETVLLARERFTIDEDTLAGDVYRAKYASVLLAQHFIRESGGTQDPVSFLSGTPDHFSSFDGTTAGLALNPWWQLSVEARRASTELVACGWDEVCAGFTPDIQVDDVPIGGSLQEEVQSMVVPWGWLAFMFDNALSTAVVGGPQASAGDFVRALAEDGLVAHAALFLAKRNLALGSEGPGWRSANGDSSASIAADLADWDGVEALLDSTGIPDLDGPRLELLANILRVFLFGVEAQIDRTGVVHGRDGVLGSPGSANAALVEDVLRTLHGSEWAPTWSPPDEWTPQAKADAILVERVREVVATACDAHTEACSP